MTYTLPDLYPHQEEHKERTRKALARCGQVILNAPTGTGKTRIAKFILAASAIRQPNDRQSGRTLFTVHRRGLVDNAAFSFAEEPALPHGTIMAGCDTDYGSRIQVASIDTLLNWFIENKRYPSDITFDLIIIDEAHSHHSKFQKFLKYHDERRKELGLHPAYVIGLTATPEGKGLSDVYKEIVPGPATQWLIDNKFLSPFRYFRATEGKLELLVKRGGEFTTESVSQAMTGLSGDLVRDWKKFAEGRPTVGFFPRRSHAREAMEQLQAAGLRVEYVDGETPDEERRVIFRCLNSHAIDYLCNVQVVERGTDIPRIGCVQLCVAIGSIVRYRQMIGRGSRCHPDKVDCMVLDHGGNIKRHGFFEDDPPWSLDVRTKETGEVGARPTIECPQCQAIYRGGKCKQCGYEPTRTQRRSQGLEFDGGELKEVKKRDRKQKGQRTADDLMISALYRAGKTGRTFTQAAGMFKGMSKQQGTDYYIPKTVVVAGHTYRMIPFGHTDGSRKVSTLYPFTAGKGHGGPYEISSKPVSTQSLF